MLNKKILLIEDDEPIREMVSSVLEVEGYDVVSAKNGSEGIQAIRSAHTPDVILLDMMMPVMNGWEVLDILRANAQTARIPVVILSAYGETAASTKPTAFVPKPIQLKTLLSAIERCCA